MASQLQQVLRSLCCNTPWKYAVFWKLTHRARMMLTWEDAYYDNDGFTERRSPGSTAGNLQDGHYSNNHLGVALAKMSYHVYSLGEGIVGQVAITGKHLWLSADKGAAFTSLAPEHCDGWQTQFSAGIKTIVVVAVAPHGVLRLGSLENIPEDLRVVKHIRDVFAELQESLAGCFQSSMQNSMENSCVSEISTRTSGSEVIHDCVNNLGRSICEDGRNTWSPLYTSFEKSVHHSCVFPQPGSYPNKILEVVNKQGLHKIAVQGSGESESFLPPSSESYLVKDQVGQIWPETDPKFEGQTSTLRVLGNGSVDETATSLRNSVSNGSVSDSGHVTKCSEPNRKDLSSELLGSAAYSDLNAVFALPRRPNAYPDKCSEKSLGLECGDTMDTPFRFCAGYELYEALGPVFQKGNSSNDWESEKSDEMAGEMLEGIGTNSLLMSDSGNEHLLEAVIANVNRHDNDCTSIKSFGKSVNSLLTTEVTAEPCNSDVGTISSTGYSFDRETLNSFNSSGACSIRSSRGFSSTSCSRGSGHERPLEPVKMHKKRARPGESCRPRPRDRQLIQDRIKELRELVPNGSKCSIDSLLERTIKHMLFMQSVTKHADKLNKCSASKLVDKDLGTGGSSSHEHGSSWAVEVGSNLKVCPMRVENIGMNGQMLVEVFEDSSHFLDMAEAIRSLGLTILKGVAEANSERTRMCFVVEGQNDRTLHRMDVLWSLMQLLQAKVNV